MIKLPSTTSG